MPFKFRHTHVYDVYVLSYPCRMLTIILGYIVSCCAQYPVSMFVAFSVLAHVLVPLNGVTTRPTHDIKSSHRHHQTTQVSYILYIYVLDLKKNYFVTETIHIFPSHFFSRISVY